MRRHFRSEAHTPWNPWLLLSVQSVIAISPLGDSVDELSSIRGMTRAAEMKSRNPQRPSKHEPELFILEMLAVLPLGPNCCEPDKMYKDDRGMPQ